MCWAGCVVLYTFCAPHAWHPHLNIWEHESFTVPKPLPYDTTFPHWDVVYRYKKSNNNTPHLHEIIYSCKFQC